MDIIKKLMFIRFAIRWPLKALRSNSLFSIGYLVWKLLYRSHREQKKNTTNLKTSAHVALLATELRCNCIWIISSFSRGSCHTYTRKWNFFLAWLHVCIRVQCQCQCVDKRMQVRIANSQESEPSGEEDLNLHTIECCKRWAQSAVNLIGFAATEFNGVCKTSVSNARPQLFR